MKKLLLTIVILISFWSFVFPQKIRFAWITDTHIGSPNADRDLMNVVQNINLNKFDFVIATGDITEKGLNDELIEAKKIFTAFNFPLYIIPGNHDTKWSESGCTKFIELFGDNKFYFEYKDFIFVGLNTGIPMRGGGGHFEPHDLKWLDEKLNDLPDTAKIIFACHHQPDGEVDNWYEVTNRLMKFNFAFIIVGHGHANRKYSFAGIPGAMGRSTLSRNKSWGYNLFEVFDENISITEINADTSFSWYEYPIIKPEGATITPIPQFENSENVSVTQIFNTNSTMTQGVTYSNNSIYFADLAGNVYSIAKSGKTNWKLKFNTAFYAKPLITKNFLILAGTDGSVYFLQKQKGKLVKQIKLGHTIISTHVYNHKKNSVFAFTNDGYINKISLKDLLSTRVKISSMNFEAAPLQLNNNLYIGSWDNYIYKIPTNFSQEKPFEWKWTENKNFYYSPAVAQPVSDGVNLYITTPDKYVSAIDIDSGKTVWRTNAYNSWESIGISNDKSKIFIKGVSDTIYCVSISNNTHNLIWKTNLDLGIDTNPTKILERNNRVYVATKKGFVYALNSNSGEIIWKAFLGTARVNNLELADKDLLIATNMDGKVFLITEK
jgi:outer membrane protein assembly factor BamB